MTKLKYRPNEGPQSVRRETLAVYARRPICIELQPETIVFRLKGTRTKYRMGMVTAFEYAVRLEAMALLRKKKLEREQRRKL